MEKRITLLFLSVFVLISCHTAQPAQTPAATTTATQPAPPVVKATFVSWDKKLIDIGKVKRGDKKEMFFEFTNTSGEKIQIEIVDACHCTTVEFPRGVIDPGGKGRLDVVFDSTEKEAPETIDVLVVFKNTDPAGNPRMETVQYKFELE